MEVFKRGVREGLPFIIAGLIMFALSACGKVGVSGAINHMTGNWAQVNLPADCAVQQIAAEEGNGVAVLCKDGRVFH